MSSFGIRLGAAMVEHGPVCVGIDPHRALLEAWGLPDTVDGLRRFSLTALEAFAGHAAAVKPQSAFFERFGSAGVAVLEEVLAGLREAGTLSLLDVKRGDIGSTMGAYADAYLCDTSPLRADAVTVSPYLGFGSLNPALELAQRTGRGVFVLAMTSNPEGSGVQHATWQGTTVAGEVIAQTTRANTAAIDAGVLGDVGLVVGATVGSDIAQFGLADQLAASAAPLLAPGFGAQGATVADVTNGFGAAAGQVLLATSRAVLQDGPDIHSLRAALRRAQDESVALRR